MLKSEVIFTKFKGSYCNKCVKTNNFKPYIINKNDYLAYQNELKKNDDKYKKYLNDINK